MCAAPAIGPCASGTTAVHGGGNRAPRQCDQQFAANRRGCDLHLPAHTFGAVEKQRQAVHADADGVHLVMGAVQGDAEAARLTSFDRDRAGASVDVDLEGHPLSASWRAPCFQRVMFDPAPWAPACALARMYASRAAAIVASSSSAPSSSLKLSPRRSASNRSR